MKYSEVASRYAKALYSLSAEQSCQDNVFEELRQLANLIEKDQAISSFVKSPLVKAEDKASALDKAVTKDSMSEVTRNFILLLASKNRLDLIAEITEAYQDQSDAAHGVVRGMVRSAVVLSPDERARIESQVAKATKKQVILNYKEDKAVIGGLIAQVGTYTFDDTLSSHLRRMKEDLNRRSH